MNNPTIIQKTSIKLVGLTARTSNALESNPETANIGKTIGTYYQLNQNHLQGLTYSVYTDYVTDHTGDYTYFFGHVANDHDKQPAEFVSLEIPAQTYFHFKTDAGTLPEIVINAWQLIWKAEKNGVLFGKKRNYKADFEVYGESHAPDGKAIVDIYIGVE